MGNAPEPAAEAALPWDLRLGADRSDSDLLLLASQLRIDLSPPQDRYEGVRVR